MGVQYIIPDIFRKGIFALEIGSVPTLFLIVNSLPQSNFENHAEMGSFGFTIVEA